MACIGTVYTDDNVCRCIDPQEDRVALVIGGKNKGNGLKNIEVYLTANIKGMGCKNCTLTLYGVSNRIYI